mmetsp:Transcript_44557/g.53919  ORF Transcript_44557/g.53919 Transcript_44557/m.53919 type:complete len:245 (-) Transcript_44557:236-970(-)
MVVKITRQAMLTNLLQYRNQTRDQILKRRRILQRHTLNHVQTSTHNTRIPIAQHPPQLLNQINPPNRLRRNLIKPMQRHNRLLPHNLTTMHQQLPHVTTNRRYHIPRNNPRHSQQRRTRLQNIRRVQIALHLIHEHKPKLMLGRQTCPTNQVPHAFMRHERRRREFNGFNVSETRVMTEHFNVQESDEEFFGTFFVVEDVVVHGVFEVGGHAWDGFVGGWGRFEFLFEGGDFTCHYSVFFLFGF